MSPTSERGASLNAQMISNGILCFLITILCVLFIHHDRSLHAVNAQYERDRMVGLPPDMRSILPANVPPSMMSAYPFASAANDELSKALACQQIGLYVDWKQVFARLKEIPPETRDKLIKQIALMHGLPPMLSSEQIEMAVSHRKFIPIRTEMASFPPSQRQ